MRTYEVCYDNSKPEGERFSLIFKDPLDEEWSTKMTGMNGDEAHEICEAFQAKERERAAT